MLKLMMTKIFGTKADRELKKMMPTVQAINGWEPKIKALSDEQLRGKTDEFRARLQKGETLDDLLPEAFAVVREASVRALGMRQFDVQMLGGLVLNSGAIAEMRTGEGKTLTATAPVYLNALSGKGSHVVTVNDYLARRDAEWMGKVYNFLGMSVGVILHGLTDEQRREAYNSDITYGTNNEFGFDYLRDNMKHHAAQLTQRGFNYAIVDEVDSVLIDEARTPLIIAGPAEGRVDTYYRANQIVVQLNKETHYTLDEKDHHALFNEAGVQKMETLLGIANLYDPANIEILHCLEQSLKAHHLFKRDIDYVVEEGEVVIIDSHTGRKMPGRRYSDGLHQALEAKENVNIEQETQTLASVTFQNFFRMYGKLAGMTGTAATEASEFLNIYKLEVLPIPTNRPVTRKDFDDEIYGTKKEKYEAIIKEIEEEHKVGRPLLVGTIAIETSELMSELLRRRGIKHVVLNAKFHAQESEIVAQAGRFGAVTIATNMAGRGTDIILGGNPEMLTTAELSRNPNLVFDEVLAKYKSICEEEKRKVLEVGGLCILGTERHDARRIDNQLRGRAGRQGDPGSTKFYLSLEDNLMRLFGSPRMKGILMKNMEPGVPIQHRMVSKSIERAQKSVETRNFEVRKHLLEYDDVMAKQRNTFYRLRRELLAGDARQFLFTKIDAIASVLFEEFQAAIADPDSKKRLTEAFRAQFHYELDPEEQNEAQKDQVIAAIKAEYEEKWRDLGIPEDAVRDQERFLLLYIIDQQWKDHMRSMDHLKEGISLQGYAQKDPLIEYKKASYGMFNALLDRIDEESTKFLIFMRPVVSDESILRMRKRREQEAKAMQMQGGGELDEEAKAREDKAKTFRRSEPKVGRNEPCHCGSGKKYKHCHGAV